MVNAVNTEVGNTEARSAATPMMASGEGPSPRPESTLARIPCNRYTEHVIASFGDGATEDLFNGDSTARVRRFPAEVLSRGPKKLDLINAAAKLDDLRVPPGNRLEALKGDLAGYHSIRINGQWRVVFIWKDGAAHEVRIDDYH